MEMTEGPFAYCENCTAQPASGGNNMSFSRALSGGTERQVSGLSPRPELGGRGCSSRIPPGPRAAGPAATPIAHQPVSAVTWESPGPVGLFTHFAEEERFREVKTLVRSRTASGARVAHVHAAAAPL